MNIMLPKSNWQKLFELLLLTYDMLLGCLLTTAVIALSQDGGDYRRVLLEWPQQLSVALLVAAAVACIGAEFFMTFNGPRKWVLESSVQATQLLLLSCASFSLMFIDPSPGQVFWNMGARPASTIIATGALGLVAGVLQAVMLVLLKYKFHEEFSVARQ
jgi:hypothetical protein